MIDPQNAEVRELLVVLDCFMRYSVRDAAPGGVNTPASFEESLMHAPRFFYRYYIDRLHLNIEMSYKSTSSTSKQVGGSHDPDDNGGGDSEGGDDNDDEDSSDDDDNDKELKDDEYEFIDGMEVNSKTPHCLVGFASAIRSFKIIAQWLHSRLHVCNEEMYKHSRDVRTIGAEIAKAKVRFFI